MTAADAETGVREINVWLNDAPDGSFSGAWMLQTILGNTGTATFDLSGLGAGTYAVVIDIFDHAGNSTHWWEGHADPGQTSAYASP